MRVVTCLWHGAGCSESSWSLYLSRPFSYHTKPWWLIFSWDWKGHKVQQSIFSHNYNTAAQSSKANEKLSTEAVEGTSLPLEGVDHIHGGDRLPLGVLGVGDGVADDVLEEDLENASGLLVDEARDPLDAAPPGQAPDGGLRDALKHKRQGRT